MKKIRAVSILIHKNKVLLIFRRCNNKEYYTFPGGGKEKNETIKQAVLRELYEETTIRAEIDKLLYIQEYDDDSKQYFYLLKNYIGISTPKLHDESIEKQRQSKNDYYKPMWVDIKKLNNTHLYPLEIRDWLIEDIKNNFSNRLKKAFIKMTDSRE